MQTINRKTASIAIAFLVLSILLPDVMLSKAATQTDSLNRAIETDQVAHGCKVSYFGRPSEGGRIELNANNGFFAKGVFRAEQKQTVAETNEDLISAHFRVLTCPSSNIDGTARWHLWLPQVGKVKATVIMKLPPAQAGSRWQIKIGKQELEFKTVSAESFRHQPWDIEFDIAEPGKHTFEIRRLSEKPIQKTELHRIELTGTAIEKASILRARWRPAAVHAKYSSSACPDTKMWVFETQSLTEHSSYSPMTTRFGYFGASFDKGNAAGGVNFSMWAAKSKTKEAPPLEKMPHLLATGNRKADFGGFGHEGSGVKIRNWRPYSHHPKSVIQALRVESKDGWDTFSGYLFDERTSRWTLYAIGRKPQQRANTSLRSASFCEVPGPPARQRSGDQLRIIRRRGWFLADDKKWHPVDQQTTSNKKSSIHRNKFIEAKDGWLLMGTGGMEMLDGARQVKVKHIPKDLPHYLESEVAKQLFEKPVDFGTSKASHVTTELATIDYDLTKAGTNSNAVLHFGTVDCLTFVDRELHATEKKGVSKAILAGRRTWQNATPAMPATNGINSFLLTELKPNTKYFYRLLVTNEEGKSWDFVTGQFQTK